ncbi:MAG: FlxA-like family protein [Clostridium sp.]|nr:FlxA-like family protein [Clostridium sp.]
MTINGISGAGAGMSAGQSGMPQGMDPVSKDIQNQISRLQKQLQELSANTEMSGEAKMKKRQELQKQINDLNVQLRQHQVEMRKKEREEKESFDDMLGTKPQNAEANDKGQGMPSAGMEAMISAGVTMEQAKVNGSVAAKMEGRAGVLKAEISLDAGHGGSSNAELKQAELADVEEKAMNATASQMDALSKANETMKEAGEASGEETSKADKDSRTNKGEEEKNAETVDGESVVESNQDNAEQAEMADAASVIAPVRQYTPVDVRL